MKNTRLPLSFLFIFFLGFGMLFSPCQVSLLHGAKLPQNAILITIDTLRADHLGCYGYQGVKTPNLDQLANQGVLFEQAYSPVPLTLPAHASILTGLYPPAHNLRTNGSYSLNPDLTTLAERFKENNYTTAAFVSSFVLDRRFGLDQGFSTYDDHLADDPNQPELLDRERRAEQATNACLAWLKERKKDEKFFLWLHYMDPHEDYHPPAPYNQQYSHNLYDGEIAYTDYWLGELIKFLQYKKVLENTLLIITGDHGESLGEHGEKTHGIFIYDCTLHVPLIVYCPSLYAPRRVSSQVRLVDLAPTLLESMGGWEKGEKEQSFQGISLVPLLEGKTQPANLILYCESLYPQFSHNWSPLKGVRTEEWKYIEAPQAELLAVKKDPGETSNVLANEPKMARSLAKRLVELDKEIALISGRQEGQALSLDPQTRERLRSLGYVTASAQPKATETLPDPKQMVPLLQAIDRGAELFGKGKYQEALKIYQEVIGQDSANPDVYLLLGYTYEALGDDDKSIQAFEQCLQLEKTHLKAYLKLGFQAMKIGDYAKGVSAFKEAININPGCATAYLNLGQYYLLKTGEIQKARDFFTKAKELDPKDTDVYNLLALAYQKEGRLEEAVAEYQLSLELTPKQAQALANLGLLFQKMGRFSEACQSFQQALKLKPDDLEYLKPFLEKCPSP